MYFDDEGFKLCWIYSITAGTLQTVTLDSSAAIRYKQTGCYLLEFLQFPTLRNAPGLRPPRQLSLPLNVVIMIEETYEFANIIHETKQ